MYPIYCTPIPLLLPPLHASRPPGGYGIQGLAGTLIPRISGDYFNVVGFPLHAFARALAQELRKQ